jgi:hypothetical protein
LLALIALAGVSVASQTGLRLEGHGARYPAFIGLAEALAVAIRVAALDCYVFRSLLVEQYAQVLHLALLTRFMYFVTRAFNENILYRLFVFSSLLLLLTKLRIASPATAFAAMFVRQYP